ncbi:MAG TPA: DUF2231 domain-containing protein [Phenylobacterium sp.]|uniref:DUF2231 domain-containing protein n=1 Tax=Phenylobacterium sp. TaxID=1871053 RepID=UPI002B4983F7|nr:DUF2231 domain-containing protein [Phenylobacterium sp.]HKR86696.1 DUF2231 domain-containing protein [Phenylobacterium sp.]
MTNDHNPKSTASIAGHPIHPMIVPFPIAFFVSALVTDVVFLSTGRSGFADASMWLLGAGIAGALLAAIFGFTDFLSERRIRALRQSWLHMGGNLLLVVLQAVNFYLRAVAPVRHIVSETGVVLSAISVALLLFTGWMGWEMVYRGHVGVASSPDPSVNT